MPGAGGSDEASKRVRLRDVKPFCVPGSLDDLHGPGRGGSVTLPVTIYWAPGDGTIPLDSEGRIDMVYQAVIAEGSAEDQCAYLDRDVLIEAWPRLNLPIEAARLWQDSFPELRGNMRADWPRSKR